MAIEPRRVDQVIPTLAGRDAIGQHTLALRDLLREQGLASDIFYLRASSEVQREGRPLGCLDEPEQAGRWLLYQLSIGSSVADVFARRPEAKLVNYHNITPVELLRRWEPEIGEEVRVGRSQLLALAPLVSFALADSRFNEGELAEAGYRRTAVTPLLIDYGALDVAPDPSTARRLAAERANGGVDLLFVGKVGPHKAPHDLLKALAAYRRLYDPAARLRLVGGMLGTTYPRALRRFAEAIGVADAVDLPGSVSHQELVAYYRACDVFVCLSDHEGFGVPLIEAMVHRLPVIAYGTAAVAETVGDGGLVLPNKEPVYVAAAVDRVLRDPALRSTLAEGSARRLVELSLGRSRARMADVIHQALTEVPPDPAGAPRRARG